MGLLHRKRADQKDGIDSSADTQATDADAPPPATQADTEAGPTQTHDLREDRDDTVVAPVAGPAPGPSHEEVPDDRETVTGAGHRRVPDHAMRAEDTAPAVVRERSWSFAPGQLVSLVAGSALVAVGAVALVRAGLGEPLDAPIVEVLGYQHTAWLGLAEIGLGALLMLAGTGPWGRWLSVLLGATAVVAGVVVLAEAGALPDELAAERDFGWPLVGLGAVVAVAAMALPVWRSTYTNVRAAELRDADQGRPFWSGR